jgi:hypothetical protein
MIFYLFLALKQHLEGHKFKTDDDVERMTGIIDMDFYGQG